MTPALRTVERGDLQAVARLHALCFPADAWDAAALAGVLDMRGADARLAEVVPQQPLGLVFDLLHGDEIEILTLGVHPAHRRRGIARLLLADLFQRGQAAGARHVMLEVAADNAAALALYEACGFRTVGQRRGYYQRPGGIAVDAWLLRRALDG